MSREFQIRENQTDNVTVVDEELDVSFEENDGSPNEQDFSYASKSYSKISRQQSQNRSQSYYDGNNNNANVSNNNNLLPIQESEDSVESPSQNKRRSMQVKQTIQTAGFGIKDSISNRQWGEDYQEREISPNTSNFGNITPSLKDEHKFTLKNDSLGLPSPNIEIPARQTKKKITIARKQKREQSYNPATSQTKIDIHDKDKQGHKKSKFKEATVDIAISPSCQSVEFKRDSMDINNADKRDQRRKTTKTKTNRSRTAKTHKTTKIVGENPTQEISIPVFDRSSISMELDEFEKLKNFTYYFSWNNPKVVVARTSKILKMNLEKKRNNVNYFSIYTFNSLAISKILRIRRKLKIQEEPLGDERKEKKSVHPITKTLKGRRGSKRATQTDEIVGVFQKRPQFGTQIHQGFSFSRFQRSEVEFR